MRQEKSLRDPHHQERVAAAITQGVRRWFEQSPPPGTLLAERRNTVRKHVIARGDTLSEIAERYQVSLATLRRENGIHSANRIRITPGACHNIDQVAGSFLLVSCGGNFKSLRPTGCAGTGQAPGLPVGLSCYSGTDCTGTTTTTTGPVTTTNNATTIAPTTPAPLTCKCNAPGPVALGAPQFGSIRSYCGASVMQVSVAVLALVSVFVAAF